MTASIAGSEMPAWSKLRRFRTSAITPIDGMTASHASASMPPGSQPDSRSHEKPASASAAGPRARSTARRSSVGTASSAAAAASTGSTSASARASSWWRRSSRYLNSADWRSSRGDGWVSSMTSAMRTWRDRPS